MLSYKDKAESNVDVGLAFPNNMLYNIRLPILIYFGYRLYNKLFFNQFLQILLFGSLANDRVFLEFCCSPTHASDARCGNILPRTLGRHQE